METIQTSLRSRLLPFGLILLAFFPSLMGALRLIGLVRGVELVSGHARFAAAPVPIVLHVLGATTFCLLGAFQFGRRRASHRRLGWIVAPAGVVAALSGVWMTLYYPLGESDGPLLRSVRLVAGAAMAISIVIGVVSVVRRDVHAHGRWMIRAYALGVAAGTQSFLFLTAKLLGVDPQSEEGYTLFMAAGWILNLLVAELAIRRLALSSGRAPRLSVRMRAARV